MPQQDLSDDMGARLNKCSTRMGALLSGTLDHYHHAKYKQNPWQGLKNQSLSNFNLKYLSLWPWPEGDPLVMGVYYTK